MALVSYTWTNDVSCGAIAVAFSVTSTALQLSNTGSTWQVAPIDYNTVQDHTFSITVSGTDGAGAA